MPTPIEFPEQTTIIAKDQPQFIPIPAHYDRLGGEVTMRWKFTELERAEINRTGELWQTVITGGALLQPIRFSVTKPEMRQTTIEEVRSNIIAAKRDDLIRKAFERMAPGISLETLSDRAKVVVSSDGVENFTLDGEVILTIQPNPEWEGEKLVIKYGGKAFEDRPKPPKPITVAGVVSTWATRKGEDNADIWELFHGMNPACKLLARIESVDGLWFVEIMVAGLEERNRIFNLDEAMTWVEVRLMDKGGAVGHPNDPIRVNRHLQWRFTDGVGKAPTWTLYRLDENTQTEVEIATVRQIIFVENGWLAQSIYGFKLHNSTPESGRRAVEIHLESQA